MSELDRSQGELERARSHREGLLYVAGMLDGEGSVMLTTTMSDTPWRIRPRVTITNNCFNTLVKCGRILNCGRIEVSPGGDCFRLVIEKRADIARTLKELLPFLKIKAKQARLMLRFLTAVSREAEFRMRDQMRALNRRRKAGGPRK